MFKLPVGLLNLVGAIQQCHFGRVIVKALQEVCTFFVASNRTARLFYDGRKILRDRRKRYSYSRFYMNFFVISDLACELCARYNKCA